MDRADAFHPGEGMTQKPIRILCVDDNQFVADGIRIRLEASGRCEWVGHLQTADDLVDRTRELQPEVVLLDIDMPGKDSFEALEQLTAALPQVRTVIVSGYERDEYLDRAIEAGAWGYVSKNEGPEAVVQAVANVAAGKFVFGATLMKHLSRSSAASTSR
ncbi:MAG: response regulator transcription factor [Phycisphaerales bacterium]|nr:response regulator transcription factor [Phycisphaerales bacterium]MCI0629323.1 response regulator transcription factor [Phycisphaerales bacterium]MCI0676989.1 response regulator transcription factor [Phycisphaerales bacterium]